MSAKCAELKRALPLTARAFSRTSLVPGFLQIAVPLAGTRLRFDLNRGRSVR
jgi:hypothetical protein